MAKEDKLRVDFTLRNIEQRAEENDGKKVLKGFIPYNSRSVDFGFGFYEVMAKGCFSKTLEDNSEVRAFHNHNDGEVLGNTKSGTLVLRDTDAGLECECEIPNTGYANDLYEVVKRGDCRAMSFGMYIVKCQYEDNPDGTTVRTILEAALDEVSFGVAYPAYPETDSEADLRCFKNMRVEDMTEGMKAKVLSLGEEIRALNEESEGQSEPAQTTREEPAQTTPAEDETETEPGKDEEAERRAKAEAEALAFLFEQSN